MRNYKVDKQKIDKYLLHGVSFGCHIYLLRFLLI